MRHQLSGAGLALMMTVLGGGCAFHYAPKPDPAHYIMAHEDGYPRSTTKKRLSESDFTTEYLDPIMKGIEAYVEGPLPTTGARRRVIVFIHGGLNGLSAGLARTEEFAPDRIKEHANIGSAHFVFVNWNSYLWGSLGDDLCCVRREARSRFYWLLLPMTFLNRSANAVTLFPDALQYQLQTVDESLLAVPAGDTFFCPGGEAFPAERDIFANVNGPRTYLTYALFSPLRALTVPVIQTLGNRRGT